MTSLIDKGDGSPRFPMPLTVKPDTMINTHWQLQHIRSLKQEFDKVRKRQAHFDVDN